MFDKLKNIGEMMKKAKLVKDALSEIRVEASSRDGKIKMSFDGENMLQSISIDEEYLNPSKKDEFEKLLKSCIQEGISKAQAAAAKKMKDVMGVDLPGMF